MYCLSDERSNEQPVRLIRQLDPILVFLFAFVLLGEHSSSRCAWRSRTVLSLNMGS